VRVPDREGLDQREEAWLGLALLLATGVGLADAVTTHGALLSGFFALAAVLAAATTGWRSTAVVAVYSLVLAILSGLWSESLATNEYAIRVLFVMTAGALCTWGAVRQERVSAAARGGAVLVESLAPLGGATEFETTIERAQEQTRLAAILQQSLLPPLLPRIAELEIATRSRPAGAGEIGGDFYDLLRLGESSWAIVIGDVCGKGPEAAALTLSMRDTLRASKLRGESPKETLTLLNDAIRDSRSDHRFCTGVYARFDLNGEPTRMTLCNGGHPLPLLLRADGSVEPAGRPGTLLGVYEDPDLVDIAFELQRGDAVLLYTDGLVEMRPNSGPGVAPRSLLEGCAGRTAEEIATIVEERSLEAHGGQLGDDMAIVVVRQA
jgi:stage II sporulation SpoE-like protein